MEKLLNSNLFICLVIVSCIITSCKKHRGKDLLNNNEIVNIVDSTYINIKDTIHNSKNTNQSENEEIFYVDSVLINGKVPLYTTYNSFISQIGKQDSIKPFTGEMYSAFEDTIEVETKSLYKNNSEYELYNGELIYYNIELNQQTYITYRGNKFTHKTSLSDFKIIFPNSVSNSNKIDVHNKGRRTMVRMRVSDNIEIDERINLLFKNNYLESFHWWLP